MARGWLVDDGSDEPEHSTVKPELMPEVVVCKIPVRLHPSGLCAMLIPHSDSERGLTTQQSLNEMPRHQLALFAAVQAVEWGIDVDSGGSGTAQAIAWKRVYIQSKRRYGRQAEV
jgi:hypothetical protein